MIFYFSATGNTRWAASKLATATREQLVNIADVINSNCRFTLNKDERLGFVFPVHGWRVPVLVRKFISELTIDSAEGHRPFTFAVCTAGDDIGLTIDEYLNDTISSNLSLKAMGITAVHSAYSLIMPESYVGLPGMDVDTKDNEIRKKTESDERLQVICEEIFDRKQGVYRLDRGSWPKIKSHLIGGFFEKFLITDRPFHVDSARCVKCGICAHVCPVDDITGGKGLEPEWNHNGDCLTCFNCYHHCPHHAIEYGNRTRKKGQYYYK